MNNTTDAPKRRRRGSPLSEKNTADYRKSLAHRLRSLSGQAAAIAPMVEADRPAPEILGQLDAVRGALDAVAGELVWREIADIFDGPRLSREKKRRLLALARLRVLRAARKGNP